ncbi:GntR family transcriptional regulator [Tardiphaga sp.]|uniref:GntR family transcriptional regulator n=1 Tax=Tardiphaga sp. TaxID=1926292 RepID=UPI0026249949|nr:GntR family transcriptional regulator [Tardiphaga sp.]MDB5616835.1 GntR family transcriptional regulator [Tardiphaga sp.]
MNIEVGNQRKVFGNTVAADVTHRLREELITCRLKPGEPLRFEPLRAMFGVSFTTLREALMALVADGLVVSEGQRGFHVAPATVADLCDITDVRVLIEVNMLRQSIAKGDDEWEIGMMSALHRLNKVEERLSGPPADNPKWRTAHKEFHHALVASCGSPALLAIRDSLYDRSERYRSLSAAYRPVNRDKVGEHRALMLAAVGREADEAVALIERHIRSTTENVLKYAKDVLRPV